jgi:ATP-dependent Clp protease ATP-binding subunit ClpA
LDFYNAAVPSAFDYWTNDARELVTRASVTATDAGRLVSPADLAAGLLTYGQGNVARWRNTVSIDTNGILIALDTAAAAGPPRPSVRFDQATRQVLAAAVCDAGRAGANHVGTEHLLAALLTHGPTGVVELFAEQGITAQDVARYVGLMRGDLGVERLPGKPAWRSRRAWRRLGGPAPRQISWHRLGFAIGAVVALLTLFVVLSMR